jgi:SAM-dependent methyltransferase
MSRISIVKGRRLFGYDPASCAAARPEYPPQLYHRLVELCRLGPATSVFEVGAGTGLATRRLLELGASPLVAIEPDPTLAAFLADALPSAALRVVQQSFEDADLAAESFDLGVAATALHWLEQGPALAKVRRLLKPGGWWAMWWTQFGGEESDVFQRATDHLFTDTPDSPSHGRDGGPPFALDQDARLRDLADAGFADAKAQIWRWTEPYETVRLAALYRTFSPIQPLEPTRRERFLDDLARIADTQFGGCIERPFTTALYTARNPCGSRR